MLFGSGGLESRLARFIITPIRTATKRASGGKSANNSTAGRRLGPKKGEGEPVKAGQIIWRQRGTRWYPGENAGIGRDHTIFALEPGFVRYYRDPFHAKRKFIGIALSASDRLPTPHFEPRKRRFGYSPIDNDEIALFEKNFLTRKETHRLARREQILAQRDEKQSQRFASYKEQLNKAGLADAADNSQQLLRLDSIYQFMCGGATLSEAKEIVDAQAIEDLDVDLRAGRITEEEHKKFAAEFSSLAGKVDAALAFSPRRQLVPASQIGQDVYDSAVQRIEELAKPYLESSTGTPKEVVDQITEILESPVFSAGQVRQLKSKFLRKPLPVLLTKDNKAELESKSKKGEGEIRNVWDSEASGLKRYFVPKNGELIF